MDSTFFLSCTNVELAEKNGLLFTIKDWDFIGSNDVLGMVEVASQALTSCKGKTMEFMVLPPKGREEEEAGYLLVRCRHATKDDEQSLKKKHKKNLFETTTESAVQAAWPSLPDPVGTLKKKPRQSTAEVAQKVDLSSRGTQDPSSGGDNSEKSLDPKEVDSTAMPKPGEELHLAVKIVSCRGLIVANKTTSDPYVKVYVGEKEIHKTKHILKT